MDIRVQNLRIQNKYMTQYKRSKMIYHMLKPTKSIQTYATLVLCTNDARKCRETTSLSQTATAEGTEHYRYIDGIWPSLHIQTR